MQSKTEINIPLKREEVVVSKKPYVNEEIVIKKKPDTETRT
jgi:stress response protein YsnF